MNFGQCRRGGTYHKRRCPLPVLFAGSNSMDANRRKRIPSLPKWRLYRRLCPLVGGQSVSLARSVGGAAPYALHLGQDVDSRWAFDSRACHFGFEFLGSNERARLFQTLPFEEKCNVVYVSCAAEDMAAELAVFVPPVKGGIEHRFPSRIIGHFVVDKN